MGAKKVASNEASATLDSGASFTLHSLRLSSFKEEQEQKGAWRDGIPITTEISPRTVLGR